MTSSKLTGVLARRMENAAPDEVLDVVCELRRRSLEPPAGATRDHQIAQMRDAFARDAAIVENAIRTAAGEVLGSAWINQTIRARMRVAAIPVVAGLSEVAAVDVPRRLEPD